VSFGLAPGSGVQIKVDFQYYFRCHFTENAIESENIAGPYWKITSVSIEECLE
jgi:hypothetical protein